MINIAHAVQQLIRSYWGDHVRLGVVTGTDGDRVYVQWPDQDSAEPQSFPRLASYASPQVDDEVLCIKPSRSRRAGWVVLGEVLRAAA